MTVLFTELNCILFTALYRTFSTIHCIEFTVNDCKIFYDLILLSFMVCNRINYVFFKECIYIYKNTLEHSVTKNKRRQHLANKSWANVRSLFINKRGKKLLQRVCNQLYNT